jgi:hypothetical protein
MGHITVKTSRIAGSLQAACSQALFEAAFGLLFSANKPGSPNTRVLLIDTPRLASIAGAPSAL